MYKTRTPTKTNTSWNKAGKWYDKAVGTQGHYFHERIVLPRTLELLRLTDRSSILDVGCGQGVLARQINPKTTYFGVDSASSLISAANKYNKSENQHFIQADATKGFPIAKKDFTHAASIFALQNMEFPELAIKNIAEHMVLGGTFVMVLNHPCFRIPRHSSWGIDAEHKLEYRRVNRYSSHLKIPITMHPGSGEHSGLTWSFHIPLADLSAYLKEAGFVIEEIQEWASDKTSVGKAAKMENRSRNEFPLFMAIKARKDKEMNLNPA